MQWTSLSHSTSHITRRLYRKCGTSTCITALIIAPITEHASTVDSLATSHHFYITTIVFVLGFCTCFDGYYGEDCSNTSCPGTYCYYDTSIFQQICTFACQAGYNHTDNDTYIPDIAKLPCSPTTSYSFESNGEATIGVSI